MAIAQRKPSDFIKPGDTVIFPADSRGMRLIKIVPELGDNEDVLAYWLQRGAEPFTGEVPKCGYIFEKRVENWDPEEIDDRNWEPRPMSHVPQKVKTLEEAMRDGDYEIGVYRITCTLCGFKRETHSRSAGRKGTRYYEEQFCSRCEKQIMHSVQKIEDTEVMLPPTLAPSTQYITHVADTGPNTLKGVHLYDYKKATWIALLFLRLKEMWRKILV